MTYTQEDITNGTVIKMGTNYYLATDIEAVLAVRIKPVQVDLEQ